MNKEYKEFVDYNFSVPESDDNSGLINIKLASGDYSGVEYRYGKVSIEEDSERDNAYLTFEFDVVDSNEKENLEEDMQFKNHIGDILTSIMMKNIDLQQNS